MLEVVLTSSISAISLIVQLANEQAFVLRATMVRSQASASLHMLGARRLLPTDYLLRLLPTVLFHDLMLDHREREPEVSIVGTLNLNCLDSC